MRIDRLSMDLLMFVFQWVTVYRLESKRLVSGH